MTEHSSFPEPLDDDDDDVAWALQTAKVQWTRGGQADAIVWLRRAAESADQLGNVWRANDLRRIADEFTANLGRAPEPAAPLPQWQGGSDVDDLLDEAEESGVTSKPPTARPRPPVSSYAPVDDLEVEEDPESFDEEIVVEDDEREIVVPDYEQSNAQIAQLLGTEVELTDEVEVLDEEELDDDEEVIDDEALSLQSPVPGVEPDSFEPEVVEEDESEAEIIEDEGEVVDEPVTQPQLEDPRFLEIPRRSPLPPPHSARPLPAPVLPRGTDPDPEPAPESEPEADPQLGDVLLGEVRGLEDVPPEGQVILAREARIERLSAEEEVSSFGLALILKGAVSVMPAIADLSCAQARKGEIVWSEGNLDDGVVLRLVAMEDATEVAVWDAELLKSTVRDYPWVVEDLKTLADRFQALAGVAMGPMGERLDDSLRAMVTDRCEIKRLLPGETLTTKNQPVGGMYIMAAGRLEIVEGDRVESELGPGDFLFGAQVLSNGKAPNDTRAGKGGALVLFAARAVAHELLLSVPPLLEIFAS